jgi:hypothetical protein
MCVPAPPTLVHPSKHTLCSSTSLFPSSSNLVMTCADSNTLLHLSHMHRAPVLLDATLCWWTPTHLTSHRHRALCTTLRTTAAIRAIPLGGCVRRVIRNLFLGPIPQKIPVQHPTCVKENLGADVTIVVSVKDSCSQGPGFLHGLRAIAPPSTPIIYTYPDFTSCAFTDERGSSSRSLTLTLLSLALSHAPLARTIARPLTAILSRSLSPHFYSFAHSHAARPLLHIHSELRALAHKL